MSLAWQAKGSVGPIAPCPKEPTHRSTSLEAHNFFLFFPPAFSNITSFFNVYDGERIQLDVAWG